MKKPDAFKKAVRGKNYPPVFKKTVEAARDFLKAAQNRTHLHPTQNVRINLIDGVEEETLTKTSKVIHTFRIRGAESEERYKNDSILRRTWYAEYKLQQGIIEGRSKHVDAYLRVTLDRDNNSVSMKFTAIGYQPYINKAGGIEPLIINRFSSSKVEEFTSEVERLLHVLAPVLHSRNEEALRRLDRLTKPTGP